MQSPVRKGKQPMYRPSQYMKQLPLPVLTTETYPLFRLVGLAHLSLKGLFSKAAVVSATLVSNVASQTPGLGSAPPGAFATDLRLQAFGWEVDGIRGRFRL